VATYALVNEFLTAKQPRAQRRLFDETILVHKGDRSTDVYTDAAPRSPCTARKRRVVWPNRTGRTRPPRFPRRSRASGQDRGDFHAEGA
jgi:hypothetical protein